MALDIFLLLAVLAVSTNAISDNDYSVDLLMRESAMKKFQEQLLLSLRHSKIPVVNYDESPKEKWLQLPASVRTRLESSHAVNVKSQLDTKEIFVPVNILENCTSNSNSSPNICINFFLGQTSLHQKISSALLYVDLPYPISSASQYIIRRQNDMVNESIRFVYQQGHLLKANIDSFVNESLDITSYSKQDYQLVCTHKCGPSPFKGIKIFLELILEPAQVRVRKRRSTNEQGMCKSSDIFCCKRSFKIRPVDLGLNFIVYPDEIELNYCSGECNNFVKSGRYHKILSILRKSKKLNLSPLQLESMKSCCAPESYSNMEIILAGGGNYQKLVMKSLMVANCACV